MSTNNRNYRPKHRNQLQEKKINVVESDEIENITCGVESVEGNDNEAVDLDDECVAEDSIIRKLDSVEEQIVSDDEDVTVEAVGENTNQAEDEALDSGENEFYLLTEQEIDQFNNDMAKNSGAFISQKNAIESVSQDKLVEERSDIFLDKKKGFLSMLDNKDYRLKKMTDMLESLNSDIVKNEIEIEIYKVIMNAESNPKIVDEINRKMENHLKHLNLVLKKQKILIQMIDKYN